MTRQELRWLLVLAEISDDYEEPKHMYENISRRAEICRMDVSLDEMRQLLLEIVNSGMAKIYRLTATEPITEVPEFPDGDRFKDYYYYITQRGKEALAAKRGDWPMDGEDSLLPGWTPPTE